MSSKTNKVEDLRAMALKYTKKNVSVKTGVNRKQIFHDLLYNKKLQRSEVVFEMSLIVMEQLGIESPTEEEYMKQYKTCKNAVDTISSKSNNGATYWLDKSYSKFKLIKKGSEFTILDVE